MHESFTTLSDKVLFLPADNIDTDQIIPARFLKTISREGFGKLLFYDHRYLADDSPNPEFEINQNPGKDAKILFTGENFGCGSSREHAPWALLDYGIRAVIAKSFANIFRNNSAKNGLLLIELDEKSHEKLGCLIRKNRETEVKIDLPGQKVVAGDETFSFEIDSFIKNCLIQGVDQFSYLINLKERIKAFEIARSKLCK